MHRTTLLLEASLPPVSSDLVLLPQWLSQRGRRCWLAKALGKQLEGQSPYRQKYHPSHHEDQPVVDPVVEVRIHHHRCPWEELPEEVLEQN